MRTLLRPGVRWLLAAGIVAATGGCGNSGDSGGSVEGAGGSAAATGGGGSVVNTGGGPGTGGTGTPTGGAAGTTAACVPGALRCNAQLNREACGTDGTWAETGFVCARTVAVDDQDGSYCVTKGDGSYRCWGATTDVQLPTDQYLRVQASQYGLVGLTADGRLVSQEVLLADGLTDVATFRATQMGSSQAVCPLFRDGRFGESRDISHTLATDLPSVTFDPIDGSFSRAFCVYEGLFAGVQSDGTLLQTGAPATLPGNTWVDVAFSVGVFCGLDTSGGVTCTNPSFTCGSVNIDPCVGDTLPSFTGGPYRAITATTEAACALDGLGALTCQRHDGTPMLSDAGPYTFVEGGQSVVCAIRVDGGVTCFQHADASSFFPLDPGLFMPVDPPLGPDW